MLESYENATHESFLAIVDMVKAEPAKTDEELLVVLQQKFATYPKILLQKTPITGPEPEGGETLLHLFAERGLLKCLQFALANGADIDAEQAQGATALLMGVINKRSEIVRELLERGASTETPHLYDDGDGYYWCCGSPLACAILNEEQSMVTLLHQFRARVYNDYASKSTNDSPFIKAINFSDEETVLLGLQQGVVVTKDDLDSASDWITSRSFDYVPEVGRLKILIHLMTNVTGNKRLIDNFEHLIGGLSAGFLKLISARKILPNTNDYHWIHRSIINLTEDNRPQMKPSILQILREYKNCASKLEMDVPMSANSATAASIASNNTSSIIPAQTTTANTSAVSPALTTATAAVAAKRAGSPLYSSGKTSREAVGDEVSAADTRIAEERDNILWVNRIII